MKLTFYRLILISLFIIAGCSHDEDDTKSLPALSSRLDALEAEAEIRHKLQTYMAVLSASDWDNYVTYFTENGRIIMAEGTRTGRADIRERMSSAAQRMSAAAQASGQPVLKRADLLSNIEVKVTSPVTASAKSRFVFIADNGQGGFEVTGSGLYLDEWLKVEDEWLIDARTVDYDMLRIATTR